MVYHGHGFTWTELYNMPVWLRKFYYKKMEEAMESKASAADKAKKATKPKVQRPSIAPKRK
jgi:hypothetical protein